MELFVKLLGLFGLLLKGGKLIFALFKKNLKFTFIAIFVLASFSSTKARTL